ncbi:EAL domain-containing protein [Planctobacterium marinum]|uniref:EAL domain-containing protein n=1 Tax=Planctobacterium marinum TaxID=1631968 RepID=A0AA48HLK4_9ALTE|nr:hypothetical protein MACH26_02280 [Planctobacterium marinum]
MQVQEINQDFNLENVVPFFQPIMDLNQEGVWGYECLARLIYPGEHIFMPSDFLYLVEKNACHGELTQKIFHESAHYFRNRQVNWSINITEQDVLDPQTAVFLERSLRDYPNVHRITLEICTHTLFTHSEQFKTFILLGKTLGIQILIDRFTQPAEQLLKVLDYPIDGVKVESGAIQALVQSQPEVMQEVLLKAKGNDALLIAEHVEDDFTLKTLRNIGIEYGQGFYFSQPAPVVA